MFIQPNRRHVVTEHVQERRFPPLANLAAQDIYHATGEAISAKVLIDANGADLNMSVQAHPFAGHRNETPSMANTDVIAHLQSSLAERTWLSLLDQIEHLFRIRVTQATYLRVFPGPCFALRGNHLMDRAHLRHL